MFEVRSLSSANFSNLFEPFLGHFLVENCPLKSRVKLQFIGQNRGLKNMKICAISFLLCILVYFFKVVKISSHHLEWQNGGYFKKNLLSEHSKMSIYMYCVCKIYSKIKVLYFS